MKPTADKIVLKNPKSLTPYTKNAKVHSQAHIDKLAGIIAAYGFDQPIVIDKQGVIIKGHKRREAALQLGLAKVPCIVSTLSEYEAMASRLADNNVVGKEYNNDLVAFEIGTLRAQEFDLALTGFDTGHLEGILAQLDQGMDAGSPPGGGTASRAAGGATAAPDETPDEPGDGDPADYGDEPPDEGAAATPTGPGLGAPIVQYNLAFDNDEQRKRWYALLKHLRDNFTGDTIAVRLDAYLAQQGFEPVTT